MTTQNTPTTGIPPLAPLIVARRAPLLVGKWEIGKWELGRREMGNGNRDMGKGESGNGKWIMGNRK
jgi:hypothetical protein